MLAGHIKCLELKFNDIKFVMALGGSHVHLIVTLTTGKHSTTCPCILSMKLG